MVRKVTRLVCPSLLCAGLAWSWCVSTSVGRLSVSECPWLPDTWQGNTLWMAGHCCQPCRQVYGLEARRTSGASCSNQSVGRPWDRRAGREPAERGSQLRRRPAWGGTVGSPASRGLLVPTPPQPSLLSLGFRGPTAAPPILGSWGSPTETGLTVCARRSHDGRGAGAAPGVPAGGGQATVSLSLQMTPACGLTAVKTPHKPFLSPELESCYKK